MIPDRFLDGGDGQRGWPVADWPPGGPLLVVLVLRVQVLCHHGLSRHAQQRRNGACADHSGSCGLCALSVAVAGPERVGHHQLVAMNQALLLSYTIGSLLGPAFTAMLMQIILDNLLFIMIASVSFYLSVNAAAQGVNIQRQWPMHDLLNCR